MYGLDGFCRPPPPAAGRAGVQAERELPVGAGDGSKSLEEVLVGVARMELHQLDPARVARQMACECPGQVGPPGARRPVEDQLTALEQQVGLLLQPLAVDQQLLRQLVGDVGELHVALRFADRARDAERGQQRLDGGDVVVGEVDDVGLPGEPGGQRRGQRGEHHRMRGVAPAHRSAQVGAVVAGGGVLGVAGDLPEVDLGLRGGEHVVARAHLVEERVELADLGAARGVGLVGVVLVHHGWRRRRR